MSFAKPSTSTASSPMADVSKPARWVRRQHPLKPLSSARSPIVLWASTDEEALA